jgi:hypothetical protein
MRHKARARAGHIQAALADCDAAKRIQRREGMRNGEDLRLAGGVAQAVQVLRDNLCGVRIGGETVVRLFA